MPIRRDLQGHCKEHMYSWREPITTQKVVGNVNYKACTVSNAACNLLPVNVMQFG